MNSQEQPGPVTRWPGPAAPAFRPRRRRPAGRRLLGVIAACLGLLIAAIAVHAVVLSRQTEAAKITVPGARLVPTAEGAMQVLVQGDRSGSPVLEVHGVLSSLHWFDRITPILDWRHLVIRVDLIGNGGSAIPGPGHYRIADQARAVGDVLARLHIQHVTAIGHSMGGAVVTALAERDPADVARIVVLDTSATAADATLGGQARLSTEPVIGQALKTLVAVAGSKNIAARGFAPGFRLAAGFAHADQPLDDIKAMTYTAYTQEMAAFDPFVTAEPMQQRLTALLKPLPVIFGTRDQIAVGEHHDLRLYRTVPSATVTTIAGVGHSPQVEAPQRTAALIQRFLRRAR
jgi:pimeloyl-ACP methyl ester carboxylesterase